MSLGGVVGGVSSQLFLLPCLVFAVMMVMDS